MQTAQPRRFPLILVTFILALPFLTIAPTATAYTWTDVQTFGTGTTVGAAGSIAVEWLNNDVYLVAYVDVAGGDPRMGRCTTTCTTLQLLDGSAASQFSLERINDSTAIVCFVATIGGVPSFVFMKTTNTAATWQTPVVLATDAGVVGGGCTQSPDGSYLAAFYDVGPFWRRSTDGGATWSAAAAVTGSTISDSDLDIVAANASTWHVWGSQAANVQRCTTSDTGATWACGNLAGLVNPPHYGIKQDTDRNDTAFPIMADARLFISADGGFTGGIGGDAQSLVADTSVAWLAEPAIASAWTTTALTTTPCKFRYTEDQITWNEDDLFTLGAATSAASGGIDADLHNGILAAACHIDNNAGNSEVRVVRATFSGGAIDAAATTTDLVNLVGFDVDPGGNTVIIREGAPSMGNPIGGNNVKTFGAQELDTLPTIPRDTVCDRTDGVLTIGSHVMYVFCEDPDNDPIEFEIRSASLGDPGFTDIGDECQSDLDMSLLDSSVSDGGGDFIDEIGEMSAFPIDCSVRESGNPLQEEAAHVAMAYTGTNGVVGVQVYNGYNNAVDEWGFDEKFYSTSTPAQLCTGIDSAGQHYVAAVGTTGPPKVYDVDFIEETRGGPPVRFVQPRLTLRQGGSSALSGSTGISCAGDEYLVMVENGVGSVDEIHLFNLSTGQATLLDTVDGARRGVAISQSEEHRYYAWVDGSTIITSDGTNSTCQLNLPGGDFYGMEYSFSAQSLWAATDTTVARYEVQTEGCTTILPESDVGGSGGQDPDGDGDVTPDGLNGAGDAFLSFGVSRFGGNLIWAVAVIGGISISSGMSIAGLGAGMGVKNKGSLFEFAKWGLMIGAVLGFFVAWGFQLINTATVAGIVILAALGVGLKYYSSRVRS